jgi:hypothetical protein
MINKWVCSSRSFNTRFLDCDALMPSQCECRGSFERSGYRECVTRDGGLLACSVSGFIQREFRWKLVFECLQHNVDVEFRVGPYRPSDVVNNSWGPASTQRPAAGYYEQRA